MNRFAAVAGGILCLCRSLAAETLTFIPQPDPLTAVTNYSWFTAENWFVAGTAGDLVNAGRLPQPSEAAIITGTVDAGGTGIRVQTMLLSDTAVLTNGTFAVEDLELRSSSVVATASLNVLSTLTVAGTNCTLREVILSLLSTASANFNPAATLNLEQGSKVFNVGIINLTDGSKILGRGLPESQLAIKPGGTLSSTGMVMIAGSSDAHLVVDNSNLVRVDGGTLNFLGNIDWQCSSGIEEFCAATPAANVQFSSPMLVPVEVTCMFSGPGTNLLVAGADVEGLAQVGAIDPNTQLVNAGTVEVGDTISGAGGLWVAGIATQPGCLAWTNGTFSMGYVRVDNSAKITIAGGSGSRGLSGCKLNNSGRCELYGDLSMDGGAVINNLPGATFSVQTSGAFVGGPGPAGGTFNNAGTFSMVTGGTNSFGLAGSPQGPDFNNSGLVELDAGQLNLCGGTSSGEFRTAAGAVLWFWGGTNSFTSSATFTGSGSVRVSAGLSADTWLASATITLSNLELGLDGTIDGPGSLVVSSNFLWTGGTLQGSGQLTVSPSASCRIQGTAIKTLAQRQLNNSGKIIWGDQAPLTCGSGAALNNTVGAVFEIQGDVALSSNGIPPMAVWNNGGTLVKSAGTATSTLAVGFTNSGTVEVRSGALTFTGPWQQQTGSTTINTGAILSAPSLAVLGGTLGGGGTLDGVVTNSGSVLPGTSPGILTLAPGKDYQQTTTGTLVLELGGTVPGTQFDQLRIGGNAVLAGKLELRLINGFVPQPGEQFPVLMAASQSGRFSSISGFTPPGTVWLPCYNGTNLTLILAQQVALPQPVWAAGSLSFPLATTPGVTYLVQASDSLSPPDWQTLTTITGDGTTSTVKDSSSAAQRFYRVLTQ